MLRGVITPHDPAIPELDYEVTLVRSSDSRQVHLIVEGSVPIQAEEFLQIVVASMNRFRDAPQNVFKVLETRYNLSSG